MYFDPTCKSETKADPFSLDSLITWLERQPPDREYDYGDTENCALCQYAKSIGYENPRAGGNYIREFDSCTRNYIPNSEDVVAPDPWTFGAALERAREVAAHS